MNNEITIDGKVYRYWPSGLNDHNIYASNDGWIVKHSGNYPPTQGSKCFNKAGYPLQMEINSGSYYTVKKSGKERPRIVNVGKVILETWGEPATCDNKGNPRTEVDHIDRNPFNNDIHNLRWVSHSENMRNAKHYSDMVWLHTPEVNAKRAESRRLSRLRKQQEEIDEFGNLIHIIERS